MPTYKITVASGNLHGGGTGNVYYIDGARNSAGPGNFNWNDDTVLRFDQSDSSNDGHPLLFSTSTVTGGIITSGVSYYLDGSSSQSDYMNSSTFNAATERYIEIDLSNISTNFYYLCWYHGIGMGGIMQENADREYAVTVASGTLYISGGTGNVFYLDGTRGDPLGSWVRGGNARFDQSDSSNDGHPLLFTNNLDNISGGRITTGIKYWLDGIVSYSDWTNLSTFNAATDRYIEFTPDSALGITENAPYLYCYIHGIGMGGPLSLFNNTFGSGAWSNGNWSDQGDVDLSITGLSLTSSVGDALGVPQQGWGGKSWGDNNWGELANIDVFPSGLSLTTSLNADGLLSFQSAGWGRNTWNDGPYGESNDPVVSVTGLSMTASVGDGTEMGVPQTGWGGQTYGAGEWGAVNDQGAELTGLSMTASLGTLEAYNEVGWGRDGWGEEAYGRANDATAVLEGFELQTGQGNSTWGAKGWGNNSWGEFALDDVASVMGPTGVSATGSVGTLGFQIDATFSLTGVSATSSIGAVEAADVERLTGISMTSSVGSPTIEFTYAIDGLSATISLGSTDETSNPIIIPDGFGLTSSVGNLTPADVMGLTGVSATFNIGTLSVDTSLDLALTGLSATSNVAAFGTATGFGIQAFESVDTGSNTSYTDVA